MPDKIPLISVVFPVFNEEENLKILYQRVRSACEQSGVLYEMVFVDNGSIDGSLAVIKGLKSHDSNVRYISLSRNFGHQNAIFAGLSYASGDAVVTMDADLQHPPSLISEMIGLWRKGVEVVYTTKKDPNLSFIKLLAVRIFYWLISKISGVQLFFGQSDFRLIDKKVLKAILGIPEYHKFLRGQIQWIGFRQRGLTYDVESRYSGKSKFSYSHLFSFALDGIFSFSRYPLHMLTLISMGVLVFSFAHICFVCVIYLLDILGIPHSLPFPPGWATLIVSIFFLGSLQFIAIGILGEYVGRIYDQVKGRPNFIVREESGGTNG